MCYYNRLIVPVQQAFNIGDFAIEWPADLRQDHPLQSGFEYGDWPIIIWSSASNQPEMVNAHWEFLAPWTRSMKAVEAGRAKFTTLNAVGENLFESRLYKESASKRRCLVLSSGFYEWRHWKPIGAKKELAVPYFIYLPGEPLFCMAGIWQPWTDQETGEHLTSFAIVTTSANSLMEQVHNKKKRMPLILDDKHAFAWLDPGLSRTEIESIVSFQYKAENMKAFTISKDFRTAPKPVEPYAFQDLPALIV